MANLKSIRSSIYNLLDYAPELQSFKDQTDELINEAYLELWTDRRWNFAVKEVDAKLYPDITFGRDVSKVNVVKGEREVTLLPACARLTNEWEGQPIEIGSQEYTISKVVSNSSILLDVPYQGEDINFGDAKGEDYKIKYRYYDMPHDCMELLSLVNRDTPFPNNTGYSMGKLLSLMSRSEEHLNLRMDYTAEYPEAYVMSAPLVVPPAEKLSISTSLKSGDSSGFNPSINLELCWAFERDSHVGPLSEPATITTPALEEGDPVGSTWELNVTFQTFMGQTIQADSYQSQDRRPSPYEGLRKRLYYNSNFNFTTGERLGLPCWTEVVVGSANTSGTRNNADFLNAVVVDDVVGTAVLTHGDMLATSNRRYIEIDGQYQRIRPYPRVDGWDKHNAQLAADGAQGGLNEERYRMIAMRYQYKPSALLKDTDTPELPFEFHQLITYVAMKSVYYKLGNQGMAKVYEKRTEDAIKRLEKRYMDRMDNAVRKGSWDSRVARHRFDPNSLRKIL